MFCFFALWASINTTKWLGHSIHPAGFALLTVVASLLAVLTMREIRSENRKTEEANKQMQNIVVNAPNSDL
jgi:uncharacterized membrane protein